MDVIEAGTTGQQLARELGLSSDAVIGPRDLPAVGDPHAAVIDALAHPIDFPPLAAATAPGDCAAIALARGVPCAPLLATGAVRALCQAGVDPDRITIVLPSQSELNRALRDALAKEGVDEVRVELHDPDDETATAMLGVTAAGRALRINRTLTDADVVLPISAAGPAAARKTLTSKYDALLPAFSDAETQRRFRSRAGNQNAKSLQEGCAEADEAGWLMGVAISVHAAPGPENTLLGVFAGEPSAAASAAAELTAQAWSREVTEAGDLVLAVIGEELDQDSWGSFAQAILAARAVLGPDGAIVVHANRLDRARGALRKLVNTDSYERVEAKLARSDDGNAWPARELASALARGAVYLYSPLPAGETESLGMTPVANPSELKRLLGSYRRRLVLDQAHRLAPAIVDG